MRYRNFSAGVWISAIVLLWGCGGQNDTFYSNVLRSDIFKQQYFDSKLDFLWILDNSPSMSSSRQIIVNNIGAFLSTIQSRKAVDYQMAVTITDAFSLGNLAPAKIAPNPAIPYNQYLIASAGTPSGVVKSATSVNPAADFNAILTNLIPVGSPCTNAGGPPCQGNTPYSFWEQGLVAAYLAFQLQGATFSRTGVPLIMIEITSAVDYSCKPASIQSFWSTGLGVPGCQGVEPEHDTDIDYVPIAVEANMFQQAKGTQGTYAAFNSIVSTPASQCNYENLGTRQMELTQFLGNGGTVGSFCDADLPGSLTAIANQINNRGTVFPLTNKADGTKPMQVYVDGVLVPAGTSWHFDQTNNAVIFDTNVPKNGSTIEVDYQGLT
jgi:hypothetical protein